MMISRKADNELIALLEKGEEEGFTELVKAYQRPLLNFFYRLTWDRHLSEDFTQEVFFRVYRFLGRKAEFTGLTSFLFKIAKNIWIDFLRAKGRRINEIYSSQVGNPGGEKDANLISQFPQKGPTPAEILIGKETEGRIRRALYRLSFEKRIVFVMGEYVDMRYEQIAEVLEIPLGTVKSRMHAAVKELKSLLEDS